MQHVVELPSSDDVRVALEAYGDSGTPCAISALVAAVPVKMTLLMSVLEYTPGPKWSFAKSCHDVHTPSLGLTHWLS